MVYQFIREIQTLARHTDHHFPLNFTITLKGYSKEK
jgi:hypothetical protein